MSPVSNITSSSSASLYEQERLSIYKTVLSAMSEGFVFQDLDGKIIEYNDAAFQILRLTPDQLEGKTSLDPDWRAIREDGSDFPGKYHPVMVTLGTGKACYDVIMGIRNGSQDTRWIEVNSDAVRSDGEMIGAIATFADVTPQILMKKAFDKKREDAHTDLQNAQFDLQKLLLNLTKPSTALAGQIAIIKKYLSDKNAPDYIAKSVEGVDRTSEELLRLLAGLSAAAKPDSQEQD